MFDALEGAKGAGAGVGAAAHAPHPGTHASEPEVVLRQPLVMPAALPGAHRPSSRHQQWLLAAL